MTEQQLQEFRGSLQDLLDESLSRIEEINSSLKKEMLSDCCCLDTNEKECPGKNRSQLQAQAEKERQMTGDINRALSRIERGEYGICEACKRSVGLRHLENFPAARFCFKCMQLIEPERIISKWN